MGLTGIFPSLMELVLDMILRSRSIITAAALLAASTAFAMAQQNNPTGNLGSNRSVTASPGTADNYAASGANTGDVTKGSTAAGNYSSSSTSPHSPGATGMTKVPGTNSTMAGDTGASNQQKSGPTGSASGGGGGGGR